MRSILTFCKSVCVAHKWSTLNRHIHSTQTHHSTAILGSICTRSIKNAADSNPCYIPYCIRIQYFSGLLINWAHWTGYKHDGIHQHRGVQQHRQGLGKLLLGSDVQKNKLPKVTSRKPGTGTNTVSVSSQYKAWNQTLFEQAPPRQTVGETALVWPVPEADCPTLAFCQAQVHTRVWTFASKLPFCSPVPSLAGVRLKSKVKTSFTHRQQERNMMRRMEGAKTIFYPS